MKKKIAVFGCTGSIGKNTLDIIREFPDLFEVCALTAHSNKDALETAAREFGCSYTLLTSGMPAGNKAVCELLDKSQPDIAINGVAGSDGLLFSAAALEMGADLALANKETIVMAARQIGELAQKHGRSILPVDSEHSAIFSMTERFGRHSVRSVILTASGGPFRSYSADKLRTVGVREALNHPTWDMGQKITIDSATLANKGLEVIEACALFDLSADQVKVVIHPQSLVHSFIRTTDGVLYAQISPPDMRHPILNALTWPNMMHNNLELFDPAAGDTGQEVALTFSPPRFDVFPMLPLAFKAAENGGAYTIAYNAANEIAVNAFLGGGLPFTGIAQVTETVLSADWTEAPVTLDDVHLLDTKARNMAETCLRWR